MDSSTLSDSVRFLEQHDGLSGITKLKRSRQDRHRRTLEEFERIVDGIYESLEKEVIDSTLEIRDNLESIDLELQKQYSILIDSEYLVGQDEKDLFRNLESLDNIVKQRDREISNLENCLEAIELKRAANLAIEFKKLLDNLVSIAYLLPNELEHIIEEYSHELNHVLVVNRVSHLELISLLRNIQLEINIETRQRWEDSRRKWRKIRHDKAINDFDLDIHSDKFFNPSSRVEYLKKYKVNQVEINNQRLRLIEDIASITPKSISSTKLTQIKQEFYNLYEKDMQTVQDCHDRLIQINKNVQVAAENRVEDLRHELHVYGYLYLEPDRKAIMTELLRTIADEALEEFFRLGSGLKQELMAIVTDLNNNQEIVYNSFSSKLRDRFETILCGFEIRKVLIEKGREIYIDKIRNIISKLRTVPRNELIPVVENLLHELNEINSVSALSPIFLDKLMKCVEDIMKELNRVQSCREIEIEKEETSHNATLGMMTNTFVSTNTVNRTASANQAHYLNPYLVKLWHYQLVILFYSCDLPYVCQSCCLNGHQTMKNQVECNTLIDDAVEYCSSKVVKRIEIENSTIATNIILYLESQCRRLISNCSNIGNYSILVALIYENHLKMKHLVTEDNNEKLFNITEDYRVLFEENEDQFQNACLKLKSSKYTEDNELERNFQVVCDVLSLIESSYHHFHRDICFECDLYPMTLIHEYCISLLKIVNQMFLTPDKRHSMLEDYKTILSNTIRFNKSIVNDDQNIAEKFRISTTLDSYLSDSNIIDETIDKPYKSSFGQMNYFSNFFALQLKRDFLNLFYQDNSFILNADDAIDDDHKSVGSVELSFDALISNIPSDSERDVKYPFLKKNDSFELLTYLEYSALPSEDSIYYQNTVYNLFVDFGDVDDIQLHLEEFNKSMEAYNLAVAATAKSKPKAKSKQNVEEVALEPPTTPLHWAVNNPSLLEGYQDCKKIIKEFAIYKNSFDGKVFVENLFVPLEYVQMTYDNLRDRFVLEIETDGSSSMQQLKVLTNDRKSAYTKELEERLRYHWPRKGRVETQIKQPRYAELKQHQEKVARIISTIQEGMKSIQSKLFDQINVFHKNSQNYINDMTNLQLMVTPNDTNHSEYKNLAVVQAIDVKARSKLNEFLQFFRNTLLSLETFCRDDVNNVMQYARDYRKLCPLQSNTITIVATDSDLADNSSPIDNGFSESELADVEVLINDQCNEINAVTLEWNGIIDQIRNQEGDFIKYHETFMSLFETISEDIAITQGLGVKWGGPRRVAQEKIAHELMIDSNQSKLIEGQLQKLERFCQNKKVSSMVSQLVQDEFDLTITHLNSIYPNVKEDYDNIVDTWKTLVELRKNLYYRMDYLNVWDGSRCSSIPDIGLTWLTSNDILCPSTEQKVEEMYVPVIVKKPSSVPDSKGKSKVSNKQSSQNTTKQEVTVVEYPTLKKAIEDIYSSCTATTLDLYKSENKMDLLQGRQCPESLELWLNESRQKIFGRNGYHERSWKELWNFVDRINTIVFRDKESNDVNVFNYCIESFCLKYFTVVNIQRMINLLSDRNNELVSICQQTSMERELNERNLRPRLGTASGQGDLHSLNEKESKRSSEFIESVLSHYKKFIEIVSSECLSFVDNLCLHYRDWLVYLDSTLQHKVIQVPPDVVVEKKRLTLKRLRKALMMKQFIEQGVKQDMSKERIWQGLSVEALNEIILSYETKLMETLSAYVFTDIVEEIPVPSPLKSPKSMKDKKKDKKEEISDEQRATMERDKLYKSTIPPTWQLDIQSKSSHQALVSHAHRVLVQERDESLELFRAKSLEIFVEIVAVCNRALFEEDSWKSRWIRQVETLKKGDL